MYPNSTITIIFAKYILIALEHDYEVGTQENIQGNWAKVPYKEHEPGGWTW